MYYIKMIYFMASIDTTLQSKHTYVEGQVLVIPSGFCFLVFLHIFIFSTFLLFYFYLSLTIWKVYSCDNVLIYMNNGIQQKLVLIHWTTSSYNLYYASFKLFIITVFLYYTLYNSSIEHKAVVVLTVTYIHMWWLLDTG